MTEDEKSIEKRLKFVCFKCEREYTLLQTFKGQPKLTVECPFCGSRGVVDLAPWRSTVVDVFRGGNKSEWEKLILALPERLPTEPLTDEDEAIDEPEDEGEEAA